MNRMNCGQIFLLAQGLALCAGCGPVALIPVPQPITCHCSTTTAVYRGLLAEERGGVAMSRLIDLLVASTTEQLNLSFFDTSGATTLSAVFANLQGSIVASQTCPDPLDPATTVTMVRGLLSYHESLVELSYDATLPDLEGPVAGIRGHFAGRSVATTK